MASIERKGGSWSVRYREGGRNRRVSGLPSQRAAQAIADEIARVHARGLTYDRARVEVPAWSKVGAAYVQHMEAQLDFLAEQGEQQGALPRWTPELDIENIVRWRRETPAGTFRICGPRTWYTDPYDLDFDTTGHKTFCELEGLPTVRSPRAAMRAADIVLDRRWPEGGS